MNIIEVYFVSLTLCIIYSLVGAQDAAKLELLPKPKECGALPNPDNIIGGNLTRLNEFPWMGLISYKRGKFEEFACGGSLLNRRYVLTAAHCLKGEVVDQIGTPSFVRLGEFNTMNEIDCLPNQGCNLPPQNIRIEHYLPHEEYDPASQSRENDIGLIRLERDAEYTNFVQPVCLPNIGKQVDGVGMWVSGWGITEKNVRSSEKMKLQVPIQKMSICQNIYQKILDLKMPGEKISLNDDKQMCAGGFAGKDSCEGDSGGPAMVLHKDENSNLFWVNLGVISFGPTPCGRRGIPSIYTKTMSYFDWILANIKP